jgi:hypothetical protein
MMITSTIYESIRDISDDSRDDSQKLFKMGINILENVDATRLDLTFPYQKFDTIIFQFPNAGSREPNRGHNPNFILVRRFLKSALERIRQDGEISSPSLIAHIMKDASAWMKRQSMRASRIFSPYRSHREIFHRIRMSTPMMKTAP